MNATQNTVAKLTTTKGSTTGTIREICEWQAEMQGAFADLEIESESYDVSGVVFDREEIDQSVSAVLAVITAG